MRTKADPLVADHLAARRPLTPEDFEDEEGWFTMGMPPVAVDIIARIPGVAFKAAWKNRLTVTLDEQQGITAQVISRADLIAAKLMSGRPQDLADVDAIRRAQALVAQEATASPATAKAPKPRPTRRKKRPQEP